MSYEAYGHPVDWWCYGIMLFELMAGQHPFEADDDDAMFKNIKEKKAVFPKHFSQEAMDIITSVRHIQQIKNTYDTHFNYF